MLHCPDYNVTKTQNRRCWLRNYRTDTRLLLKLKSDSGSGSVFTKFWLRCQAKFLTCEISDFTTPCTHQRWPRIWSAGVDSGRILRFSFGPGVKRNFWPLRNFWSDIVFQLFRFSEYRNKVWQLLFWCFLCKLKQFGLMSGTHNKL